MKRIYFDSNIFRFLKKKDKPLYINLNNNLRKYSDRLIYYFSYAHLLDLKQDKTDHKFADLEFMEEFVETNYLQLEYKEKFVVVQKFTPKEAFDTIEYITPKEYFDFDGELFGEMPFAKEPPLQKLMEMPLTFNLASNMVGQSEETINFWKKIIPEIKDTYTFSELLELSSKMYENLYEDKTMYKDIRRFFMENLSLVNKYDIDIENFNFDADLRDTPLQKSFLEYVKESISKKNETQKEFIFFTKAYILLNVLGVDKEKNKKAILVNTQNDGQHAYYAAHCEYFVSDDEGLRLKAKVLYKLLGIETKVLSVEEFADSISLISGQLDVSMQGYIEFLNYELQNSLFIGDKYSFKYKRQNFIFKTNNHHFGYFNFFEHIVDENGRIFVVFYKEINNYSRFMSYTELATVTNKIVKIFGVDDSNKGDYTEEDAKRISNNEWEGRTWTVDNGNMIFRLEINKGSNEFCFWIRPS